MQSFKEYFKIDKWDLFFNGEQVHCHTGFCAAYGDSPTFEMWLKEEHPNAVYEFGFWQAKWKNRSEKK